MRNKVILSKALAAILGVSMVFGVAGCGKSEKASKSAKDYVTLGEYKGLEVDLAVSTITDEEVEEEISGQLEENSSFEEITDRTVVQDADILNINMTATINGEEYEDGTLEDYDYALGDKEYGEDFDKGLIGKNKGDSVDLTVTLPEDYSDETYAGSQATFKVTINKIQKKVVPEFNDEFVKTISEDCNTVDEYRKWVKDDLQKKADEDNKNSTKEELMSLAVQNAEITGSSDELYNVYYNQMTNDYTNYASQWGMSFTDFLSSFMGMDEESFKDYVLDEVYNVQVAAAIAKAEKIEVSDKEYKENLKKYAEDYGWDSEDELEEAYSKEYLKNNMVRDKVLTFLFDNAKITEVPASEMEADEDVEDEETDGSEDETETESVESTEGETASE